MKNLLTAMIIGLVFVLGANSQTTINKDQVSVYRGTSSDVILNDTITDKYYVDDFAEEVVFQYRLDTTDHTVNDTIETSLYYSYDYPALDANWTLAGRDTVTVSSSHRGVLSSTTKAPYFMVRARDIVVDTATGTSTKFTYDLLIDVNE